MRATCATEQKLNSGLSGVSREVVSLSKGHVPAGRSRGGVKDLRIEQSDQRWKTSQSPVMAIPRNAVDRLFVVSYRPGPIVRRRRSRADATYPYGSLVRVSGAKGTARLVTTVPVLGILRRKQYPGPGETQRYGGQWACPRNAVSGARRAALRARIASRPSGNAPSVIEGKNSRS
jgi:hypothetical protein